MEFILVEQDTTEWHYIWEWLSQHPINENLDDPTLALNNEEVWQYTGSFRQDNKVIHSLRHRCHPRTNTRMDLSLVASNTWSEEQIKKTIKL